MPTPAEFARDLNHEYERIHIAKEDAFWTAFMGLADDADAAQKEFEGHEIALKRFLQDPARLKAVRAQLAAAEEAGAPEDVRTALAGWERTFAAHTVEGEEGQALAEKLVRMEGDLHRARTTMKLGYQVPGEEFVEASSNKLSVMVTNDRDEARRRAAWEGLASIEPFVLSHGFVEIVRERNRLGRMLGGEDYYDWKVKRQEGMTKLEIFALLDDLEARTRERARESLEKLKAEKGPSAAEPWNLRFHMQGDIVTEQDPYFPFARALERWGRSFAALGIDYRDATMVLDLVDRKGKYENGFMHGPVPAWRENGTKRPARIHFTANAIPGMVGAGKRATETLFHEGGHAAHFANISMPAPCFAQEFAPTSVAFAETQSMFLDSLLDDADWQSRYAKTKSGASMPWELIEKGIRMTQPFAAWGLRAATAVPYAERAIYEIPDDELTAERILEEVRAAERRLLFIDRASVRPALSVPHLLSGDSSAYYHGYILARMAVEQTRHFFIRRDGHLLDNRNVGPDLERAYWQPGNSRSFPEFIRALTGEDPSPAALAAHVNRTPEEAVAEAKAQVDKLASIPAFDGPIDLNAHIRVMHGNEEIADTKAGFEEAAKAFGKWIESQE
jgi:Zn-dependent oligopeptidase